MCSHLPNAAQHRHCSSNMRDSGTAAMAAPPSASDLTQLSWLVNMNPRFTSIEDPSRGGCDYHSLEERDAVSRVSRTLRKKRPAADRLPPSAVHVKRPAVLGHPSKRSNVSTAGSAPGCSNLLEAHRSHQRLHAMAQCAIEHEDARASEGKDHPAHSMRALVAFSLCASMEATGLGPEALFSNHGPQALGGRTANHVARWIERHFPEAADSTEELKALVTRELTTCRYFQCSRAEVGHAASPLLRSSARARWHLVPSLLPDLVREISSSVRRIGSEGEKDTRPSIVRASLSGRPKRGAMEDSEPKPQLRPRGRPGREVNRHRASIVRPLTFGSSVLPSCSSDSDHSSDSDGAVSPSSREDNFSVGLSTSELCGDASAEPSFGLDTPELDLEQLLDAYTDDRDQEMISLVAQDLMLDGIGSDPWASQPALWVPPMLPPANTAAVSGGQSSLSAFNHGPCSLSSGAFSELASPRRVSAAVIDVAAVSPCAPLLGLAVSGWPPNLGSPHLRLGGLLPSFWAEPGLGAEQRI